MQENTNSAIQAIIAISSIFTLVAAFVVAYLLYFNQRKARLIAEKKTLKEDFEKQLLRSRVEVQEATFQHIGRELHDNVGQLLSTAKMLLGVTEMGLPAVPDTLQTASATLSKAIQEIRQLSRSLDKEWLEQFSLLANLREETERINAGGTVRASCNCSIILQMPAAEQIILFRIVQEAIQNALKHAHPATIIVVMTEQDHWLHVTVTDDGGGMPVNFQGMGTANMQRRVQLFGGSVTWERLAPQGTQVTIRIPLQNIGL